MTYFIVHICTRDGNHEYAEQLVAKAGDVADAERRARADLLELLADPAQETWEDDQLDLFDRVVTIEGIREISGADYAVLERYLPVVGRKCVPAAALTGAAARLPLPNSGRGCCTHDRWAFIDNTPAFVLYLNIPVMKHLSSTPDIMGGVLCIRGTRIPIDEVLYQLQQGDSVADISDRYHWVDPATIQGAITEALGEAMSLLVAKYHG